MMMYGGKKIVEKREISCPCCVSIVVVVGGQASGGYGRLGGRCSGGAYVFDERMRADCIIPAAELCALG